MTLCLLSKNSSRFATGCAALAKQAELGMERPSEMYVDGAYISARSIEQAKEEGWELLGPAQPSASRAGLDKAYRIEAFDISIRERKAICPAGKSSTQCSELTEQKSGKITYRFEFGRQCRDCPAKRVCVPGTQSHRTIVVGALHETLQQRRREQQSPGFKLLMQQRNGIEGSISELVRGHGLRRARYKGFAKMDLQNQLAAACNVKRWLRKLVKAALRRLSRRIYLLKDPYCSMQGRLGRFRGAYWPILPIWIF